MEIQNIDAGMFQSMILSGAKQLEADKEYINELNVFPVPDGDTGTNMTLTMLSAAKEVEKLDNPDFSSLCRALGSGSLRGARGNSGVILSQLFRGFTKVVEAEDHIDTKIAARAFQKAVDTAYKAVMKPKEGTILTVARAGAEKASVMAEKTGNLVVFGESVVEHMEKVLLKTPEMLPVLKEAGVVDSGGEGLLTVLRGCLKGLKGEEIEGYTGSLGEEENKASKSSQPAGISREISTGDIKFGYCTEFIILLTGEDKKAEKRFMEEDVETELRAYMEKIGDSIVAVADDDIVKVHVHTNHPGRVIEKALGYGALSNLKIDNMRLEHHERLNLTGAGNKTEFKDNNPGEAKKAEGKKEPVKEVGFIPISFGEGLNQVFTDLGADYIIEGGQTMNPSTEDMLNAIDNVNARTIYIFPNNKNVILAANQAVELVKDKEIVVIPTTTIPQGITAMLHFLYDKGVEENKQTMTEEISHVVSGQITYAVRDTQIDGKSIKMGDIMGIMDGKMEVVEKDRKKAVMQLVKSMMKSEGEILSIYYGEEIEEEEAADLLKQLEKKYKKLEIQMFPGGQPVYYYILSME